jgi:phosphoenolpyruvate---glycerone phosphotransferase subunit DhaL
MITQVQIVEWLQVYTNVIEQHKDELTELDAAIGDADHGINMDRGFKKVRNLIGSLKAQDISSIFKTISMTLISSIGGASGPLYGTWFLRASAIATNKQELTPQDLLTLLQAGLKGVLERGKAELGDKTMVDVLSPAVVAYQQALDQGLDLLPALRVGVKAGEKGLQATIPMLAKKGRASYLGERSIGHQDPGATSAYWLLRSLLEVLEASRD